MDAASIDAYEKALDKGATVMAALTAAESVFVTSVEDGASILKEHNATIEESTAALEIADADASKAPLEGRARAQAAQTAAQGGVPPTLREMTLSRHEQDKASGELVGEGSELYHVQSLARQRRKQNKRRAAKGKSALPMPPALDYSSEAPETSEQAKQNIQRVRAADREVQDQHRQQEALGGAQQAYTDALKTATDTTDKSSESQVTLKNQTEKYNERSSTRCRNYNRKKI